MAMAMKNDISPARSQISAGMSPVPYLLGGVGAMLVLITLALVVLAWSYFKECTTAYSENDRSDLQHNVELGARGKNEMSEDMAKFSDDKDDLRVIVIMPGDEKPSFMAKPTSVTDAIN